MRPSSPPVFAAAPGAPVVLGHRGAPRVAPENTPAAFAAAAAAGATWVELDVRRSADGVAVVHHDPVLADGTPLVALPAAELADAGVHGLAGVLAGLPQGVGVDLECKNLPDEPDYDEGDALVSALVDAVTPLVGTRPLLVSSFNPGTVLAACGALPRVPGGLLVSSLLQVGAAVELVLELGLAVVCPHVDAPGLDADGIARAHAAGLEVLVWTVDDPARGLALAAAGADALCTNDPGGLVAALAAAGGLTP